MLVKLPPQSNNGNGRVDQVFGMDFGTWNTILVAGAAHKLEPVMLAGTPYTPTVVYVDPKTGEVLIGDPALNAGVTNPELVYVKAKRAFLVDPETPMNSDGPLPAEVLQLFVTKLAEAVRRVLPALEDKTRRVVCTLTYPTGLGTKQQEQMRQMCLAAGFPVTTLLPEAVAAALPILAERQLHQPGSLYFVFDLGDGTFDIAGLEHDGRRPALKYGPCGDSRFGAHNFTGVLYECFRQQVRLKGSIFNEETGLNLADPSVPPKLRRWQLDVWKLASNALRELSVQPATTQVFSAPNGKLQELTCSIAQFHELAAPLFARLKEIIRHSLDRTEIDSWDPVDQLILVGGGSLISGVREAVAEAVGRPVEEILVTPNPLDAVARGGAMFAASQGERFGDPIAGGLGVMVRDGERPLAKMHLGTGHIVPREGLTVESTRQFVEATSGPLLLDLQFVEAKPGVQCPVAAGSVAFLDADDVTEIGGATIDISDLPADRHEVLFGFEVESTGRLGYRLSVIGQPGREVSHGTIGGEAGRSDSAAAVPTKAVIVLDVSGSMRNGSQSTGNSKIDDARQATATVARNVAECADVDLAVVTFNDAATLVLPFGSSPERIAPALATMRACAGTAMDVGLALAQEQLQPFADCHRIIFLVTDGRPANASETVMRANDIKRGGIEIVTVAIGDDAGRDFLAHQIASDPSCAWSGDNIGALFRAVASTYLFVDDTDDQSRFDDDNNHQEMEANHE
jgi:uncharacterized protein YegL